MKRYRFILLVVFGCLCFSSYTSTEDGVDKKALLERHNFYRRKVGVVDLKWSDELASISQEWANKLAKSCEMTHSSNGYGENIFWTSTSANSIEVVDMWASEEVFFNHQRRLYRSGKSSRAGHYTQIIWRETTHVGGAMQKCKHGGEIWVCNYDPAGNMDRKPVY